MKTLVLRGLLAVWLGVVLGLSVGLAPLVLAEREPAVESLPWDDARLLAEVMERVKRDYVDQVEDHDLIAAAIRGMIAELDPHSAFLDPAQYRDVRVTTSGKYSGVGIEVSAATGSIVVVAPIDGGPAAAAGVVAGDVIFSVDGMPVSGADLNDTVHRMRGPAGTPVTLGILREGLGDPLLIELRRGPIAVRSVRAETLAGGEAYVRISHFTDTTPAELAAALQSLEDSLGRPPPGLVLDLRNNPGGVLDAAVEVADMFLDSGLIVRAEGRTPEARFRMEALPGDRLAGAPLSVLVNGGSASAAEIVAGALQDHRRAAIIGAATFGKGSVQTIIPLSEGRAVKLTTSRYFTPSGRPIQARGVTPDIVVEGPGSEGQDAQLVSAVANLRSRRVAYEAAATPAGSRGH